MAPQVELIRIKALAQKLYPLIGPVIFCLALWSLSRELRGYDLGDVWTGITEIHGSKILQSLFFTVCSYLAVSYYDVISFQYIRHPLTLPQIALAGFITYGISPTLGLPFLTGGALRYRLYSPCGVSAWQITQVILFSNLSLWVGLFSVAGFVLLISPSPIPSEIEFPLHSLQPFGAVCTVLSAIYLSICALIKAPIRVRYRYIQLPSLKIAISQVLTFAVDWGFAAAVLYSLLDLFDQLSFLNFFGAYVVAMVAGLISTVPGGLGIFETIMIFFLSPFLNTPIVLGKILIFRAIYYILPLCIAVALLGWFEIRHRRSKPL